MFGNKFSRSLFVCFVLFVLFFFFKGQKAFKNEAVGLDGSGA
jgi:hypothetical protein